MLEVIVSYIRANSDQITNIIEKLFTLPFSDNQMIWIIIPILVTIILMELYYSTHKKEDPGWNTATANSLVLVFVSMDLFRFLSSKNLLEFTEFGSYNFIASCLVLFVLLEGLFLFFMNFQRLWPKFFALKLSSHLTVNLVAYTSIVLLYGAIPLTLVTLTAVIIFLFSLNILFFLFRVMMPSK